MPKLKRSASDKAQFSAYSLQSRHEKNKLEKLTKLSKDQPNNLQVQIALNKLYKNGAKYTRNRISNGHKCKGLNKILGFVKNLPTELMVKGRAPVHAYYAGATVFNFNHVEPNHGSSMGTQLAILGFKIKGFHGKRKYKKTAR